MSKRFKFQLVGGQWGACQRRCHRGHGELRKQTDGVCSIPPMLRQLCLGKGSRGTACTCRASRASPRIPRRRINSLRTTARRCPSRRATRRKRRLRNPEAQRRVLTLSLKRGREGRMEADRSSARHVHRVVAELSEHGVGVEVCHEQVKRCEGDGEGQRQGKGPNKKTAANRSSSSSA